MSFSKAGLKKYSILLSLIPLVLLVLAIQKTFSVESVNIIDSGCVDRNQLQQTVKLIGQNIFLLNQKELQDKVEKDFICIGNIQIHRILPNKIELSVTNREPKITLMTLSPEASVSAILQIDQESSQSSQQKTYSEIFNKTTGNFLLDEDGVIFATGDNPNLPKVYTVNSAIRVGFRFNDNLISQVVTVLERLKNLNIATENSVILDNYYFIHATPSLYFNLSNNLDTQFASLQLILGKAKINEEKLEFIDLRFDKPVVKFAPKK